MARDNVTQFRPRRPPPRPPGQGGLKTPRGKAVLVQVLVIATFAALALITVRPWSYLALALGIAAVAIAFTNRGEAMPWARTHHEHALRTILIGYAIWAISDALSMLIPQIMVAVFYIHIAVLLWVAVRAGVGLVLAVMRKPIWRPTGILF